jgi:hypothetical protein
MTPRTFVVSIEDMVNTSEDMYFVKFINTDGVIIHTYLRSNMIKLKKNNKFKFIFDEISPDVTLNTLRVHDCDICLCGIVYELLDNSTYISNGGLVFHINRLLSPKGTRYLTKITRI